MARVEETDADVYLHNHATIFAYEPASRMLLWARHNGADRCWELHKNGQQIAKGKAPHARPNASMVTHYEMINWTTKVRDQLRIEIEPKSYIRGRINPDKKTIYIHDLQSRGCAVDVRLGWDRCVKFALKKVGMYMKGEKEGAINYDITKRQVRVFEW